MSDYEIKTKHGYRSKERAASYKKYHTEGFSWGRIVTVLEQQIIKRELFQYDWGNAGKLLDIPCGTGILGNVLSDLPIEVTASDISIEMMDLARKEYVGIRSVKFVAADITCTSFSANEFDYVICIGFLHRVPLEIKRATLHEVARITKGYAIVSCSLNSPLQKIKRQVLSLFTSSHVPASHPLSKQEIMDECEKAGLSIVGVRRVVPFLSSHTLFLLVKKNFLQ